MHDQLNTRFVLIAGLLTGLMFFAWGFALHMSPLEKWTFHRFKNTSVEEAAQKSIDGNGVYGASSGMFCHISFDKDVPNREALLPQNLMFTLLSDLATGIVLAAFWDLFVQPRHVREGAIAGCFLAGTHFLSETIEGMIWYGYSPRYVLFETIDSMNLVAAGVLLTVLASKIHTAGSASHGTPSTSTRSTTASGKKKK